MSSQPPNQPQGRPLPQARPAPQRAYPTAQPIPGQAPQPVPGQPTQAQVASGHPDDEDDDDYEEGGGGGGGRFVVFTAMPAWLVSLVVHMILLLVLGILTFGAVAEDVRNVLNVATVEEEDTFEDFELEQPEDIEVPETDPTLPTSDVPVTTEVPQEVTEVSPAADLDAAPVAVELVDFSNKTAPANDLLATVGAVTGQGFEGRGAAARAQMVAKHGGTKGSEEAVARALKWLAAHQLPNGSWSFDHRHSPSCQGRCSHQGSLDRGFNSATAMALLPFLGAGQTHKEGKYKQVVYRGLRYLIASQKKDNGSFHESGGSMYGHGLCSIVLCEAYAMTHDRELMMPAQGSLNFIVYAQDPAGGGWRYSPRQPGDTSVVGWQLMALKSGHMAYLQVPKSTIIGATRFLDSVQSDSGSKYGYTNPGAGSATTAVGLLCRMYLGWKKDHGALQRGAEWLGAKGPSKNNMYFNYYATQVMRHYDGPLWKKWNEEMRDYLVATQSKDGHMTGSWHTGRGDHGSERGGRLYCTSMATMILEVYYRHMPIYGKQAAEEDFPL